VLLPALLWYLLSLPAFLFEPLQTNMYYRLTVPISNLALMKLHSAATEKYVPPDVVATLADKYIYFNFLLSTRGGAPTHDE